MWQRLGQHKLFARALLFAPTFGRAPLLTTNRTTDSHSEVGEKGVSPGVVGELKLSGTEEVPSTVAVTVPSTVTVPPAPVATKLPPAVSVPWAWSGPLNS